MMGDAGAAAAVAGSVVDPELFEGFATPKAEFSPVPIWWWDGEAVTPDRLRWQLDQLAEQGVRNVMPVNLAPVGPLFGARADEPALFSDEWWSLWAQLCQHARDRGVRVWFYDQIGFSGANPQGRLVTANPEFAGARLDRVTVEVDGPAELTCPPGGTAVAACALPLDDDGNVSGPPAPLKIEDSRALWEASAGGRRRLMLAYSVRVGFDYMSALACAALLDSVHGEFERRLGEFLGPVIVGSFQDELPSIPTWSPAFAEEFGRRRGYRIEPVVAALWEDWGVDSSRVRADYQRVRAELAEEAFFQPLHRWHADRDMIVGFDQQSPSRSGEPLGSVRQYADYQRTHRWYSAPGSDHWGDAKIHSSLAHAYGRPRTWIEAFHSTGWGGTLEETFDWLMPWLLAGANLYNPHAVYYSTRGGWWEWAPPSTCWRQPYWRHYRQLADTVSRLCWLLTQGEHVCDVGVLFPASAVQASTLLDGALPEGEAAHKSYLAVVGRMAWFYTRPGPLTEAGRDFDVLDEDSTAAAEVADGALRVRGERYRAVVVPECRALPTAVADRLADFCESGGLLVFVGRPPQWIVDDPGDKAARRLRELVDRGAARLAGSAEELPALLGGMSRSVAANGPVLHRQVGDTHVLLAPAARTGTATSQPMLPWIGDRPEIDGSILPGYWDDLLRNGYTFDQARFRDRARLLLPAGASDVEQWDPLTGAAWQPPVSAVADGVEVEVGFANTPAAVLVWRVGESPPPSRPAEPEPPWRETPLDGTWTSRLIPTIDPGSGDLSPARLSRVPEVCQWRVRHRVEDGPAGGEALAEDVSEWMEARVGVGVWAWQFGPARTADMPPPGGPAEAGQLGGQLAEQGWVPVRYSLSRGIPDDPLHRSSLGPKGRVAEEFWNVDDVAAGEVVALRTTIPAPEARLVSLATAANGLKEVWWNGRLLPDDPGGHLRLDDVELVAGSNLLEVRVTATSAGRLRGYWALTNDPAAFTRPSWITPAGDASPGSTAVVRRAFTLPGAPVSAALQLGTRGAAKLLVNGHEVAVQGSFDPYDGDVRVFPYDVARWLRAGDNLVEVEFSETGTPVAALVDAAVATDGGEDTPLMTDAAWTAERDGAPTAVVVERSHHYDPSWALLRPRPHPLPRSAWLNGATDPGGHVLDLLPDAFAGRTRPAEWFRLVVPPGAVTARLPLAARRFQVWLDGAKAVAGANGTVALANPAKERRVLTIRVEPDDGRTEGALWDAPPSFQVGAGKLAPGDWADIGLGSYSGGVEHSRAVVLDESPRRAVLDLGAVRGTAEVVVNGIHIGARVWSPYRFDVSRAMRAGENQVQVTVFNTLAPYLDDISPTTMVFAGQRVSGLLGPVRLRTTA